jgi:hypothetical protein
MPHDTEGGRSARLRKRELLRFEYHEEGVVASLDQQQHAVTGALDDLFEVGDSGNGLTGGLDDNIATPQARFGCRAAGLDVHYDNTFGLSREAQLTGNRRRQTKMFSGWFRPDCGTAGMPCPISLDACSCVPDSSSLCRRAQYGLVARCPGKLESLRT